MNGLEIVPFAGFILLTFLIAGRIIFLKKRAVNVSEGSQFANSQTTLLYLLFLLIFLVWLVELAKPVFQYNTFFLPDVLTQPLIELSILDALGTAFVIAALILMAASLLHFKNSLRFGLDKDNQGELITTGIFSFSRNPFFLSLDLYFVGVALIFTNVFFIGFAVLGVVAVHFFILKEERFLKEFYGDEYEQYSENVRRYL